MRAQIFSIIRQTFAVTIGKIYLGASPNKFPINFNQKYLWNYCTDVKYESIADRNDVTCALFVVVYHISEVAYLQILNKRNVYSQVFKNVEIKATCHSNQIITGNTCYACKRAEGMTFLPASDWLPGQTDQSCQMCLLLPFAANNEQN